MKNSGLRISVGTYRAPLNSLGQERHDQRLPPGIARDTYMGSSIVGTDQGPQRVSGEGESE